MSAESPRDPCGVCPACVAGQECAVGLDDVQSAAFVPDPAQQIIARALDVIESGVPSQAIGWYPVTGFGENVSGALIKVNRPLPVDPEVARREYVLRYHRDDPFAPARHVDSRKPILAMADIGGREGLLSTEYGSELLPEYRVEWETTMYLRDGGRMLGALRLGRSAQDGEFRPSELDFLKRTQPLLERAYVSALERKDQAKQ
jgi:hypothetical protein